MDRPDINWRDRPERVWTRVPKRDSDPVQVFVSEEAARTAELQQYFSAEEATLHRPSLVPVYGGETLLEALWAEMDRLMEGLMTQADAEDGGDRYRAEELAWVIAICSNPYAPSMDAVRAEAMERWNAEER